MLYRRWIKARRTDKVKVLNLQKALRQKVNDEGKSKTVLISIGERAEAVAEAYESRQLATQDVLAKFRKLAEEYARAARESDQLGLDENTFAIYTILKDVIENVTSEQAQAVNQVFAQFSDYQWDNQQASQLRIMLYRTLEPTVGIKNIVETANKLLRLERV